MVATTVGAGAAAISSYGYQKMALETQTATTAEQFSSSLMAFLDKFRLVPPLLSQMGEVTDFYRGIRDQESTIRLLNIVRAMAGARQIRLLGVDGSTLAASAGYGSSETLANEYSQDYFKAAIGGRLGRGYRTLDGERLYLFAAPVRRDGEIIGVIVLDASLALVEQSWALARDPIFVTDDREVVIMGNRNLWIDEHFGVEEPSREDQIRTSLVAWDSGILDITAPEQKLQTFLHTQNRVEALGWNLHVLSDMAGPRSVAANIGIMTGFGSTIFFAIMGWLFSVQRRSFRSHRGDRANALRLERRVRDRTRTISATNVALEREIAERRNAELELNRAQEELLHATKLAAIGQTSAALSHEFNQPLAAIRFSAENAKKFLEMQNLQRVDEKLTSIVELVDRMAKMSSMLRIFASRRGGSPTLVSLSSVLKDVDRLTEAQLMESKVRINKKLPRSTIVMADPVGLSHVFSNLISNACQALKGREERVVDILCSKVEGGVQVIVRDTGPGIEFQDLQKIFEPFFTTKDVGQGLGLGLAISKAIIVSFGGKIEARNRQDRSGAEFFIILNEGEALSKAPRTRTIEANK